LCFNYEFHNVNIGLLLKVSSLLYSDICPPGEYFNVEDHSCEPCATGYYQDHPGQNWCKMCSVDETTVFRGSNDSTDCYG